LINIQQEGYCQNTKSTNKLIARMSTIHVHFVLLAAILFTIFPNHTDGLAPASFPSRVHPCKPSTSKPTEKNTSRRTALQNIVTLSFTVAAATTTSSQLLPPEPANALEACRPKARNCIRTTWTAPSSTSKSEAIEMVRSILNSYPSKGQNGIDCNGWKIVDDSLENDRTASTARLEYSSCVGPAAVSVNLAQPFIDDVKLEINESSGRVLVDVKSSSRMGASDFFVNQKRMEYLGGELRRLGWEIPDVRYGSAKGL